MFIFSLPYSEAMKIAKKLAHSVSDDNTRYNLKGVFMHKAGDGLHYAVSSDGHMLTRFEVHPIYESGDFPDVIFPTAAIRQIESFKLANRQKAKAIVTVSIDGLDYKLECEGQVAGGTLIDGTYPDYQRVIPSGWESFTNEYGKEGFSPIYLASIMKAASYDAGAFKATASPVRMFFSGGFPAVVKEAKDPRVIYVLMPMRSGFPDHSHARIEQAA